MKREEKSLGILTFLSFGRRPFKQNKLLFHIHFWKKVSDRDLCAWIIDHIPEERGAGYKLKKIIYQFVTCQCFVKPIQSFEFGWYQSFKTCLSILKHVLIGLLLIFLSFYDTFKDCVVTSVFYNLSFSIFVSTVNPRSKVNFVSFQL